MRFQRLAYAGAMLWLLLLPAALLPLKVSGQGLRTEFGKNIIQHKEFDWYYYSTTTFDVYYYTNGKELAQYTLTQGQASLKEIEKKIDYPFDNKITFIIYNSYTDYRQSNFRLSADQIDNTGGKTQVQTNRAFLYFDGSHQNFAIQIRAGIARILMNDILYGGNLQEKLQNNVLLNVPDWYMNGLVEYIGEDWSPYYENKLRNGILSDRFRKFKKLTEEEAQIIGHSIWKYINDKYGEEALSNILYIMRANKSIESGYLFVLGKSFVELYDEWYQFHLARLTASKGDVPSGTEITKLKKVFKKGTVTQVDFSPRGDHAAVVTNDMGRIKLWIVNMETGRKRVLLRYGYRYPGGVYEYNYPLLTWSPKQNELTVIYEKKSPAEEPEKNLKPNIFTYNLETKKRSDDQIITRVDRVLSINYHPNARSLVMSAVRKGQSDLYTFDVKTRVMKPLTEDIYDDLQPRYVHNGKGIVWASNRPDLVNKKTNAYNYKFNNNFDIFYFPIAGNTRLMKRLSNSPANEMMPDAYDSSYYSYLTDENGIWNRNAVHLDSNFRHIRVIVWHRDTSIQKDDTFYTYSKDPSRITLPAGVLTDSNVYDIDTTWVYEDTLYVYPQTNYKENILSYYIRPKQGMFELFYIKDRYHLYQLPMPKNIPASQVRRWNSAYLRRNNNALDPNVNRLPDRLPDKAPVRVQPDSLRDAQNKPQSDTAAHKVEPYFQSDFPEPVKAQTSPNGQPSGGVATVFGKRTKSNRQKFPPPSAYELSFSPDYVITQLDNTIINSPYIPYKPDDPTLSPPIINGMFKIGLTDMFKDYRLIGGFRVIANLRGAEYFLTYENVKRRMDKRIMFFRRGETQNATSTSLFRITSNEIRPELRWPFSETASLRMSAFGRMDRITYLANDKASLERTGDDEYWAGGKGEFVYDNSIGMGMNLLQGFRAKAYVESFNSLNKGTLMQIIGGDFRVYVPVSRQIIFANRVAYATSMGTGKVVYFLGGVDNWILPEFNNENPVDPSVNYIYKSLASNMRGFAQNVRNGNSYIVLNSELRVPVFKYIFRRPFRSQFVENFQVVGFTDIGSAWNGFNPFNSDNAFSKRTIIQGPMTITVINKRDPFVIGYGFGFRSVLLGYFLRLDYAWGIEDQAPTPRKVFLSLGLDF